MEGVIYFKDCSLGVGAHAEIRANIFVEAMVHHGMIAGDIYASRQVSIKKPGQVDGRIFSPRVSTEKGAILRGSIEMEAQNIDEIYDKFYGAATATLIEENTQVDCEVGMCDAEAEIMQAEGNRNNAWPIFYPRT
jgi:cytoskeletal protein CcmA (bactofilin family)